MSREIRFRAWEKPMSKEWCKKRGISFVPDFKGQMLNMSLDNYFSLSRFFGFLDDEEHILMQYTGLKDKNGKPIFEGDIVKEIYYPWLTNKEIIEYYRIGVIEHPFYVMWKIRGTTVLNEEKKSSYHKTEREVWRHPTQGKDWIDANPYLEKSEIIGNVYENKNLIEK